MKDKGTKYKFFFESLTFFSFIMYLFTKYQHKSRKEKCFYFECSFFSKKILIPLLALLKREFHFLSFEMMDVRDSNNELIRERIVRKDLFEFEEQLIKSSSMKSLNQSLKEKRNLYGFILK